MYKTAESEFCVRTYNLAQVLLYFMSERSRQSDRQGECNAGDSCCVDVDPGGHYGWGAGPNSLADGPLDAVPDGGIFAINCCCIDGEFGNGAPASVKYSDASVR